MYTLGIWENFPAHAKAIGSRQQMQIDAFIRMPPMNVNRMTTTMMMIHFSLIAGQTRSLSVYERSGRLRNVLTKVQKKNIFPGISIHNNDDAGNWNVARK